MESQSNAETQSSPRPGFIRLVVYFLFAWAFSFMVAWSSSAVATVFFDLRSMHELSFLFALIGGGLALLQFGSGAFVLGTLIGKRLNIWIATIIYAFPMFAVQMLSVSGIGGTSIIEQIQADSKEVMQLAYLVLNPLVSFYFIRVGQDSSFSRRNAALDIPWQHWLWILPTSLYPAVGVPLFLLLLLWKIDFMTGDVAPSIFSLPALIPRIIVFFILSGVLTAILAAYTALSTDVDPRGKRILKVAGVWVLLVVLQGTILFYGAGKNLMALKEQHKIALEHYTKAIELNPQNSMAFVRRAKEYATEDKETQKALEDYSKAISLDSKNLAAYLGRAEVHSDLEQWDETVKDYTAAIQIAPSNPRPYVERGQALEKLKRKTEAKSDYQKAITLEVKDADGFLERGNAHQELGEYKQAIQDLNKAKRLDPNDAHIYIVRAMCYQKLGETQKAVADGALATTCFPQEAESCRERGVAYYESGDYEKAIADLTHAIGFRPKYAPLFVERGNAYQKIGEVAAAKQDFEQAAKLDPKLARSSGEQE